jgi:hypothetical protein
VRWHYRDPQLVWLIPCAYTAHLLEEWFGGFPEWVGTVVGSPLPRPAFLAINAVALALMLVATQQITRRERSGWMAIALATIIGVNGVGHILGSLATRSYSPGLITGVVFYLPLAKLVLMRAWLQASGDMWRYGVASGIAIHAVVVVVAYSLTA